MRKTHTVLVGKQEGTKPFKRPRHMEK